MAKVVLGHDGHTLVYGVLPTHDDNRAGHDVADQGFFGRMTHEDYFARVVTLLIALLPAAVANGLNGTWTASFIGDTRDAPPPFSKLAFDFEENGNRLTGCRLHSPAQSQRLLGIFGESHREAMLWLSQALPQYAAGARVLRTCLGEPFALF